MCVRVDVFEPLSHTPIDDVRLLKDIHMCHHLLRLSSHMALAFFNDIYMRSPFLKAVEPYGSRFFNDTLMALDFLMISL